MENRERNERPAAGRVPAPGASAQAERKLQKSLEREEARIAGMDNITGNRRLYRDPTAEAAIEAADRALACRRWRQSAPRTEVWHA